MSNQKEIKLGFVNLGSKITYPEANHPYDIVSASDVSLSEIQYPDSPEKRLDLTLISFYIENLPDFSSNNEGMLKIGINTRNPKRPDEKTDIFQVVEFPVKDGSYAPGVSNRGVFRNIIFRDYVNLSLNLTEVDVDLADAYNKMKTVASGVEGLNTLDVLSGIPYLGVAKGLIGGIMTVFAKKSTDDIVWSNIPLLDITPGAGVAFLRSGIYVVFQARNESGEEIDFSNIEYKDGKVSLKDGEGIAERISNCLVFSVKIKEFNSEPV